MVLLKEESVRNIKNGLNKSIIGPVLDVENNIHDRTTRNTPIFNSISIFLASSDIFSCSNTFLGSTFTC